MSHRLAWGAAAALLLALPAHGSVFVCAGSPLVCSVPAGNYTNQAFLDVESPSFQASNAGNFIVTAGFGINAAVAVLSPAGGTTGAPSSDFQFTDTGSATLNGPSSIGASASSFQVVQLQSVGGAGASGQGGGAGGDSGTVTATLTNTTVTASFQVEQATARLSAAPDGVGLFTTTLQQDRVAARVGVGLQLLSGQHLDLRVQYDGEFGSHSTVHGGALTAAWRL